MRLPSAGEQSAGRLLPSMRQLWVGLCAVGLVVMACDKDRERPPLVVVPAPIPAPPPVTPPPDAAVAEAVEPKVGEPADDAQETEGVPDDAAIDTGAVEGLALKRLLLRDPEAATKALETVGTPDAWQVAILAQLLLKRGESGPDLVPESALPEVESTGAPFTDDAGIAYVATALLPLRASAKARAPQVMLLPINTELAVTKVEGAWATVSVKLATDVRFGKAGSDPIASTGTSKTGAVELKWLSTNPIDAAALSAWAASKTGSPAKQDEAVVLLHRAFLIDRTEDARSAWLDAAWVANRASWVVNAATAQLHVAPKRIDVAWACVGEPATAKWVSFASGKLPAKLSDSFCLSHVDVRKPCSEKSQGPWQKRVEVLEKAAIVQGTVVQLVVDATRPRVLWFYSTDVRTHDACAGTQEVEVDMYRAHLRRLVMPLGTSKTVVRVESSAYQGTEFGVVAAPSDAKARSWLRKRSHSRWTLDERTGELNVSLGVTDTNFEDEHDVNGVTYATQPAFDCSQGC